MIDLNMVQQLTTPEKIQLMEALWQSFDAQKDTQAVSPAWHESVLTERKNLVDSGQAQWMSLQEVRAQFE
jgi:putative addiction module component (TIGR02574 family)